MGVSLTPFLKAKIHRARITDANLHYEGSISIGPDLIEAAQFRLYQKVEIYNVSNGERLATYVIEGKSGEICLNGAAAWKGKKGDIIIIATYTLLDDEAAAKHQPIVVHVDEKNQIKGVVNHG